MPCKGVDLILAAVAGSERLRARSELVIVGDGPERRALQQQAVQHGFATVVRFLGKLPQTEVAEHYRRASVFVFPSIRDFGGAVVMEAMASGLPSIVIDYGGPAEYVTAKNGAKVPLGSLSQMTSAVRAALEQFEVDRASLDSMSFDCIRSVQDSYLWSSKARQVAEVYARVLTSGRCDPVTTGQSATLAH